MPYIITIDVDEDALRYVTTNTTDPLEEVILQELFFYGLEVSGINVLEVKENE